MSHINSTIIKDDNLILRASAAATAVATGTGINIGPGGVYKAVCNVTALATSGTLAISIEGSTAVGGTYYTLASFPTISATGIYELYFSPGAYGWVRYETTAVHSTESITYEIIVTTTEK